MSSIDRIFALLLATGAMIFLIFCGWLFVRALIKPIKNRADTFRMKKLQAFVEKIDLLIAESRWTDAVRAIEYGIIYESPTTRLGIAQLREHHQNILSRCINISDEISSEIENLAHVESLFLEQAELSLLRLKASETFNKISERRENIGKDLPKWSKAEFEKREGEIVSEIKRNRKELEIEVGKLLSALLSPTGGSVTYH